MRRAGKGGFTLIETIVALLLSSVIMILVSTTFLVQNRYYAAQVGEAGAHDNVRASTQLIASEVRPVMEDGVIVAGPRTLTVRTPMVLGVVCDRTGFAGANAEVQSDGGKAALDTDEVAGVALRDPSTGDWSYQNATWSYLQGTGTTSAAECAGMGADTTGASSDFYQLAQIYYLYGYMPSVGDLFMLFRETTYTIGASTLDPSTLALFRKVYGGSPVEFATGMDSTAQFQYRTGGSTYADTVTSGSLGNIDAIRLVADARRRSETGIGSDPTFGWSVNIALRNVP